MTQSLESTDDLSLFAFYFFEYCDFGIFGIFLFSSLLAFITGIISAKYDVGIP